MTSYSLGGKMQSQFQNCSGLNHHQLQMINVTLSITGGVGMLVAGITVTVLLYMKAYTTVLQILFIYGVLSTLLHEATHVANIEHYFQYSHQVQDPIRFVLTWASLSTGRPGSSVTSTCVLWPTCCLWCTHKWEEIPSLDCLAQSSTRESCKWWSFCSQYFYLWQYYGSHI